MANMIKFFKGLEASLPTSGVNGALYITTDEGAIYLGTGTGMKRLGDFVQVDNVASLPEKAHESCLYYCVAENILAKWNGTEWKQINKQPTAEEMKTLLGLGTAAYKNEGDFDAAGSAQAVRDYVGNIPNGEDGNPMAESVIAYVNKKTDGIATSGNLEALGNRVTTAESEIDVLQEASAKHVEKEEGKSLIADTEITRLAGMSDGANKVEKSETNGNIKVDGAEVVVYTHPEKHAIADVDGLQDALNGLQAKGDYAAEEHTHTKDEITDFDHTHTASEITDLDTTIKGYDYATKTELGDVNKKFADYKTAIDQKAIDDEQDRRLGVIEGDYLKAADIADFETKENVKKVSDELGAYKTSNDAAVALKADKSVVDAMYTNTQIDTAVQGAKDYAQGLVEAIPAQTDYTVTCADADYEATTDAPAFKRHTLTQNGNTICTIDIPKELVVEAGSVKEVAEADKPYAGAVVGDKYIELVIANQDEPIYVPAKDLVDIYTAKDGATEVQVAISNTNEISATLVNGGITEEKLAQGVKTKLNKTWEEVGVAAGLVEALENGQVKTNKEAIEAINNESTGILKQAKDYADGLAGNYAEAEHDHVVADITDFDTAVADKIEGYGYATTGYVDQAETDAKAYADTEIAKDRARLDTLEAIDHDAYVAADAALKKELQGEIDADVKALADTVYTKTEVEALLSWGEF